MKIILWVLWIIWTWFFWGYLYFSNEDLANIIFYVLYFLILGAILVIWWKIFSWLISWFWYDHYNETIKPITLLFIFLWIISLIWIWKILWTKSFENNLTIFSNSLSNRIEVKKWEKPVINLSSDSNTWTTNN